MKCKPQARPRKGHSVAFTPEDIQQPVRPAKTIIGLRFTVEGAHGGRVLVDFVHLKPRRLAIAFASSLRELGPTIARSTILQHINSLKQFFCFLAETKLNIGGPEHLHAEHIDDFERWLEAHGKSTIHRHAILSKVIVALRIIDAGQPSFFDERLKYRLAYTSARPVGRSTPRDAYSSYVAKQLREAARADIQAIVLRLRSPAPIEHPDTTLCTLLKAADAVIGAQGTIGFKHPTIKQFYRRHYKLKLGSTAPIQDLHARHHLTAEDIVPCFVLLSLETGLEPECLKMLRVDCLRNPASVS